MSDTVPAAINFDMLAWARESLGMSRGDVASTLTSPRLSVERLAAWEVGDFAEHKPPTVAQVEKLAKFYDRSPSMFYLPARPIEPTLPPDFRLAPDTEPGGYSPDLIKAIRRVRGLREAAMDLAEEIGDTAERFSEVGLHAALTDDPEVVGQQARQWLGISDEPHTNQQDGERAFGTWRSAIEDRGILVFVSLDGLPISSFRGFALVESHAPAIAVNNKDVPPARLFTLIHELGHIVLGVSAVSGEILDLPESTSEAVRVERWCNRFAAAALIPGDLLQEQDGLPGVVQAFRQSGPWEIDDDRRLRAVAKRFAVSAEVIVRRLVTLGNLTVEDYRGWRRWWYDRYPYTRPVNPLKPKSGPGQSQLAPHRFGMGYMRVVFEAYWQRRVGLYDLCRLMGNVQVATARKIEDKFKANLFAMAI